MVYNNKIILCGLPSSGKTTFIAALWYILFHDDIPASLSLENYPLNRKYLSRISEKWCKCSEIGRTIIDEVKSVSLQLRDKSQVFDLVIPDMSGETWRSFWCDRVCPAHAYESIQDATGIILFLHPALNVPSVEITEINGMAGFHANGPDHLDQESTVKPLSGTTEKVKYKEWDPKKTPTQVAIIDILQSLISRFMKGKEVKLSIVISAWDLVINENLTPEEYIESYFPLLNQFLAFSGNFFGIKIFGISAQGGDISTKDGKNELMDKDEPFERILVVEGHTENHDITAPIQCLI